MTVEELLEVLRRVKGHPEAELVGYIAGVPVFASDEVGEGSVYFLGSRAAAKMVFEPTDDDSVERKRTMAEVVAALEEATGEPLNYMERSDAVYEFRVPGRRKRVEVAWKELRDAQRSDEALGRLRRKLVDDSEETTP